MILPLIALLGVGLLLAQRSQKTAAKDALAIEAERIIRESKEIIQGKREAYSDPVAQHAAELARAQAAAKMAQAQEGTPARVAPAAATPKPGSGMARPTAQQAARPTAQQAARPTAQQAARPAAKPPATPAVPINTALARSTAPKLAQHLTERKRNYDRAALKLWQARAGIAPDGIYGRGAAAALKYYTPKAPPALFAVGVAKYTPPKI